LNSFDIIEVVDKKRGAIKGYFLDAKHKDIIEQILNAQKKAKISSFVGMWEGREDITLDSLRENAWKK